MSSNRLVPHRSCLCFHLTAFGLFVAGIVGGCNSEDSAGRAEPERRVLGDGTGPTGKSVVPQVAAPVTDGPLVAFLGDSIAAGLHLPAEEAFPAVLQRLLADADLPFRLVNAGVSGDTTAGGLRRIDWLLTQEPDLVVCEVGGNDGLRGIAPEEIESNLRAIVAKSQAAGAKVLMLGHVMPPNYGEDYTQAFAAVFDRVAEDTGIDYVPFFLEGVGGVPELNLPDGLHPTAEGHERIAAKLLPALRGVLEDLGDATVR